MSAVNIDNSNLKLLFGCEASYVLSHVYGLGAKNDDGVFGGLGNLIHDALEIFFTTRNMYKALIYIERNYRSFTPPGYAPDPKDKKGVHFNSVLTNFESYCKANPPATWPFDVIDTERTVGIQIAQAVNFWFKRDMVVKYKTTGDYAPVDHKTRWGQINHFWLNKFEMESQFTGYLWASKLFGKHEGYETTDYLVGNIISMAPLPSSNRICKLHDMKFSECGGYHLDSRWIFFHRTPEQLDGWKTAVKLMIPKLQDYQKLKDFIDKERRSGKGIDYKPLHRYPRNGAFTGACTWCEFKDWCRKGFNPLFAEEFVQPKVWAPWDEENTIIIDHFIN